MISFTKSLFRTINKQAHPRLLPILLLFSLMLFSNAASAQKTWAFGTDTTNWPTTLVMTSTTYDSTIDGLRIVAGGSAWKGIEAGTATFSSATFGSDTYTSTNRLSPNGASTSSNNLPTKRFLSFPVTGPCTIKAWIGATAVGRTTFISNGTSVLGSLTSAGAASPFPQVLTVNYTGSAATIYVYTDAAVYYYKLSWTPSGSVSPTLTPDTSVNTVDNNLDIAFTDDATWRAAVTAVKIGTTTLTSGTDYVLSAGNLQLKPSGLNSLLTTSGSKSLSIIATGYAPASVTQIITAGTPTSNSTVSINPALAKNTSSTVTCTAKDQYNNLVSGYAFKFNVSKTDTNAAITESYTLNSVAYTTNASGVSTGVTDANGVTTFTAAIPAVVNAGDGVSFQVTLADSATNIGAAFSFINVLTPQTITFGALSTVNYSASGTFSLNGSASSGLPVSYTSSNPLVATVSGSTVTIVGVGTTSITASQSGDATYDSALSVSHDLVINCGATSNNTTTISACGSYTWANTGVTYTTSGIKTGTTTNCVTQLLDLTISGSTNVTNVTVCDPYTWANTGQTYTVSGIYDGTTTDCVLEQLNLTINAKNSFYVDADGDGFGAGTAVLLCATTTPSGYATNSTDCDDTNATIWRTGTFFQDVDGDGYTDKSTSICYGNLIPAGYLAVASSPNKVWDFSNTTLSSGIGATDIVTNQLGLYPTLLTPGTVNMGAITASPVTFAATATTDAFGPTVTRLQLNGGGSTTTSMPTQRYAYFDVDGPCRVLVWFRTGGSGIRNLFVTDGTNVVNSLGSTSSSENLILKANYAGGAGRLYIYGDQSCNIYKIQVTGANVTTQSIVAAPTTLNFVANTTSNSVDNNIDITFTDDSAWRTAVTAVKIGAVTLTPGTDYTLTAGNLRLKPSGRNAALTIPGSKKVNILANGYSSSLSGVTQTITAGAASSASSVVAISAALAQNSTRTITCTAKDQFGNAVAGYAFKYLATITNNGSNTTETYVIDGATQSTTASNTITAVTNASGVATFTVTLPSEIDSNDGISIQVKLNDGTNLGSPFSFTKTATPIVTVVNNCGTSVLSTNAAGNLLWSTGEITSSITVSSAGTYTVTSTVNDIISLQGASVAAPIYTVAPTASSAQTFCSSGTVASLVATGTDLKWYAAATGGSALTSDVALTSGNYYVSQTDNGCESPRTLVAVTITNGIDVQPVNTTICSVLNSTASISVVATPGTSATYAWYVSTVLKPTWTIISTANAGTTALPMYTNYTTATLNIKKQALLVAGNKYRVVVTNGFCGGTVTSNEVTLTVNPLSVVKTISGAGAICNGSNKVLTLATGSVGTTKWQANGSDSATAPVATDANWTDIAGTTDAATYTAAPTTTTWYRVVATSGACSSIASAAVKVTVSQPTAVGTLSAVATTLCKGATTALTLTSASGTIAWQKATVTNGVTGAFAAVPGNVTTTLTTAALSATTAYRVVVSSGVCTPSTSEPITITVSSLSVVKTISGAGAICNGSSKVLTLATGSIGTTKWQSNVSDSATAPAATDTNWTNIAETTNATTFTASPTTTTWYRVVATSGACSSIASAAVKVAVNQPTAVGALSSNTTVCTGSGTTLTLESASGSIAWQKATVTNGVTGVFAAVAGNVTTSFTTPNLTATTAYRVVVSSGVCTPSTSNVVTVTVSPVAKATAISGFNTNTAASQVCVGTSRRLTLATGYVGTIEWLSSTTLTGTYNPIDGATGATYDYTPTTAGAMYFKVRLTSSPCSVQATSAAGVAVFAKACSAIAENNDPMPTSKVVTPFAVKAYPNPSDSTFQLNFTTTSESQIEMRVYDMIGKLIETRQFSTTEMNNQEVGNSYSAGVYNLIVTQGEEMKTLRVIKK